MNTDYDEIEIDLVAFLWRMASHWKPVILAGFLCGVIFCVYSYHSESVAYKNWQAELMEEATETDEDEEGSEDDTSDTSATSDADVTSEQPAAVPSKTVQELIDERTKAKEKAILDSEELAELAPSEDEEKKEKEMTADQKESVEELVTKQLDYEEYATYIANSPLMNVDSYNKNTLLIRYRIVSKTDRILDESASNLVSTLLSEKQLQTLSNTMKANIEPKYIRELFTVSYTPVNSQISKNDFIHEGMVNLNLILSEGLAEDNCAHALKEAFENAASLNDDIDFEFMSSFTQKSIDSDLLSKQNTFNTGDADHKSEIKTAVNAFSDEQLEYYGKLVSDNKADKSYFEKETSYRQELYEEVEKANNAVLEAVAAAKSARDFAEISAQNAARAEEQAELKASEAEEAAKEAVKAKAAEKIAKLNAAEESKENSVIEANDNAASAEKESDNAQRAAIKARSAAEVAALMAEEAETAAKGVDTAVSVRENAKDASLAASKAADEAEAKASEALLASQAATEAASIANASEQAAIATQASEDAQLAAEEAQLLADETEIEEADEEDTDEEILAAPSFKVSKLAIGMILGMMLYGGVIFVSVILWPKVCEETSSELLSDRRTIWLREYKEPKTFVERFLNDVYVYRLRHSKLPALEQQIKRAAASLDFFAKKSGIDSFVLLSTNDLSESDAGIRDMLIRESSNIGLKIKSAMIRENDGDYYDKIEGLSDVVLVSEYGITGVNALHRSVSGLKEYGINLLGHLVLGE